MVDKDKHSSLPSLTKTNVYTVIMLNVVMLNVIYAECHYAECRYAECHLC
jgi:hypothetical protein